MHDFTFNGVSLSSFAGRILQAPSHTVAQRNKEFVKIYGQSGDEVIDNESYDNVDFSIKIGFLPYLRQQTAHGLAYAVIDWLAPLQNAYYEYRDTYNPGYFTKAVLTNIGEVTRELRTFLTATLKFNRVPFWYSDAGAVEIQNVEDGDVLNNSEVYTAEPIVYLTYTGNVAKGTTVTFGINDNTVSIRVSKTDAHHILDGVRKQHYRMADGEKVYLSSALPPVLGPGENVISISRDSLLTCSIIPNWRRL